MNNRIAIHLLRSIQEVLLKYLPASGGRNIGQQFFHLQKIRTNWLFEKANDISKEIKPFSENVIVSKELILSGLQDSGDCIAELIDQSSMLGG